MRNFLLHLLLLLNKVIEIFLTIFISLNCSNIEYFLSSNFVENFKLQVTGATNIIQQLLSKLKATGEVAIILFSRVAVRKGFDFHSQVSISKGAIEGLARALSAEYAPNIKVNAIAPSRTNTPLAERLLNSNEKIERQSVINPLKKVGRAEDIAEMAKFFYPQNRHGLQIKSFM